MHRLRPASGISRHLLPEAPALPSAAGQALLHPKEEGGMNEFEQWIYEFKRVYGGSPSLTYSTLRVLLDMWHEGIIPPDAVRIVKTKEAERGHP